VLYSGAPTCLSSAYEPPPGHDGAVRATSAIPPNAPFVVQLTSHDAVQ